MLDKDEFLEQYGVKKYFEQSELKWEDLESIYEDYTNKEKEILDCCKNFENFCKNSLVLDNVSFHSIRCRPRDPEHLIEKIIRKRGKEQVQKYFGINSSNYLDKVRDLIGMRILVVSKEEWEGIFDELTRIFPKDKEQNNYMAEDPVAYIRYGDRNIFKSKIHMEHSNKGYRSQHYIVKYNGYYCEIQCRTLAEEVYGEFDHIVKYPYRTDNNFLLRYTSTLSRLTDSIDEMISTCFQMKSDGWSECEQHFEKDEYFDWQHTSQDNIQALQSKQTRPHVSNEKPIDIAEYMNNVLLRKEGETL